MDIPIVLLPDPLCGTAASFAGWTGVLGPIILSEDSVEYDFKRTFQDKYDQLRLGPSVMVKSESYGFCITF